MCGKEFQNKYSHEIIQHDNPNHNKFEVRYAFVAQALQNKMMK